MTGAGLRYFSIALFCVILAGLQVNSSAQFRIRRAACYEDNRLYDDAIKTYIKILRKDSVKKDLSPKLFAKVHFDLASLYAEKALSDVAIESYAAGSARYPDIGLMGHAGEADLAKDRLAAIGLLEGGRFDLAVKEFRRLKEQYPYFQDSERYIATASSLSKQGMIIGDKNFFFSIGDAYIQNQLYEEARAFYTKRILDYGVAPIETLKYLREKYSDDDDTDIKRKVWGDNIFVTLEDFETMSPRLARWLCSSFSVINGHYITKDAAYKGSRSEFLDITYTKGGFDYWAKNTNLPMDTADLKLGVRLFVKSDPPSPQYLACDFVYPSQKNTGTSISFTKQDVGNGWKEFKMEDLQGTARGIAARPGYIWDTKRMFMGKIVFANEKGISCKVYVDNIELYLTE